MGRAAPAPLPEGTTLDDKYVILRHIKTGGMGAVYEVEHKGLGKRFAAKLLLAELVTRPRLVERFRREARAASATGHENIVEVTDLGETRDGVPFLVMELLQGRTLGAELKDGRFAPERAVHVLRQILGALTAAHARNIVHRDLKPENIYLIQRAQDPDFVKVLDFGIAKLVGEDDEHELTETGQVLGTPSYMAPEQARGDTIDHRVDVYAAGAMLYRMVTGQRPYSGANLNALLFAIAEGKARPARALNPHVSEHLQLCIDKAMHLEPSRRFASAEAFASALVDEERTFERGPSPLVESAEEALGVGAARTSLDRTLHGTSGPSGPAPVARGGGGGGKWVTWALALTVTFAAVGGTVVIGRKVWRRVAPSVLADDGAGSRARVLETPHADYTPYSIRVEPAGAAVRILVDGLRHLDGGPVRIPSDGGRHVIRVEADGYQPEEKIVIAPQGGSGAGSELPFSLTRKKGRKKASALEGTVAPGESGDFKINPDDVKKVQKMLEAAGIGGE